MLSATDDRDSSVFGGVGDRPTPLAEEVSRTRAASLPPLKLSSHRGVQTPWIFGDFPGEIKALLGGSAIIDSGFKGMIRIRGEDRLRWLNGMASNAVQSLPEGRGNYTFLLNAQGRIQGDGDLYRRSEDLLLVTERAQVDRLMMHLDHYIIMDDVNLEDVSGDWTFVTLAGPKSAETLAAAGVALAAAGPEETTISSAIVAGVAVTVVRKPGVLVPRFELWFAPQHMPTIWGEITAAGTAAAGLAAAETLRVLEATPLYGIDISDRDLAQETGQTRALNFSKGCYLGQEIVERVRSRGQVHRRLRQLSLTGAAPPAPFEVRAGANSVGQATSTATLPGPDGAQSYALGIFRLEGANENAALDYEGGTAAPLASPTAIVPRIQAILAMRG